MYINKRQEHGLMVNALLLVRGAIQIGLNHVIAFERNIHLFLWQSEHENVRLISVLTGSTWYFLGNIFFSNIYQATWMKTTSMPTIEMLEKIMIFVLWDLWFGSVHKNESLRRQVFNGVFTAEILHCIRRILYFSKFIHTYHRTMIRDDTSASAQYISYRIR